MGLGADLLSVARQLAVGGGNALSQAMLRRSVSTVYYGLFHLLLEDVGQRWQGSAAAKTGLERALNHGTMKTSSLAFDHPSWTDWHGLPHAVPQALRRVARTFIELQARRLEADYNNSREWSATDVEDVLRAAEAAFEDWHSVRTHPLAGDYLLSMLIGKPR